MPEFNQQTLNYTTEYSKAMANAYPYWSYFSDLYGSPNSATYKPLGGQGHCGAGNDRVWRTFR